MLLRKGLMVVFGWGSRGNGLSIDGNGTLITRMILCLLGIIIFLLFTGTGRIECG